jgi:hypothetical protein
MPTLEARGARLGYPWATAMRDSILWNAKRYAHERRVPHYLSLGQPPTPLFHPFENGRRHGNFADASFRAVQGRPTWAKRLGKPHPQKEALPPECRDQARELDSSTNSDALLMNVFCHPDTGRSREVASLVGLGRGPDGGVSIEFGTAGVVPLADGKSDSIEFDMEWGDVLVEAKLAEKDFSSRPASTVERYAAFKETFDASLLPKGESGDYLHYQLLRNVLAASFHKKGFTLICDARRPDLLRAWWDVMRAIKRGDLRSRCRFVLWQELAGALHAPSLGRAAMELADWMSLKYGIRTGR